MRYHGWNSIGDVAEDVYFKHDANRNLVSLRCTSTIGSSAAPPRLCVKRSAVSPLRTPRSAFDLGAVGQLDRFLGMYYHVLRWPGHRRMVCIEHSAYFAALVYNLKELAAKPKLRPSPIRIAKELYPLIDYVFPGGYSGISAQMINALLWTARPTSPTPSR